MDKLLTAEQLFETVKVNRKLPKVGSKEFDKTGSWLEDKQINFAIQTRKRLLEVERVERSDVLINAYWDIATKKVIVTKNTGKHLQTHGYTLQGVTYLYPEEALYLAENKCLELSCEGITMSLERCYEILSMESVSQLNGYRVYSHLSLYGYKVFRCTEYDKKKINNEQDNYNDLLMTRLSIMLRKVLGKVVPFNIDLYINGTLMQPSCVSSLTTSRFTSPTDSNRSLILKNTPHRGFARTRYVHRLCPTFSKRDRALQSTSGTNRRKVTFEEDDEKWDKEYNEHRSRSCSLERSTTLSHQDKASTSLESNSDGVEIINLEEDSDSLVKSVQFEIVDLTSTLTNSEESEDSTDSDVQHIEEKQIGNSISEVEEYLPKRDSGLCSNTYLTCVDKKQGEVPSANTTSRNTDQEVMNNKTNLSTESLTQPLQSSASSPTSQALISLPNSGHENLIHTTDMSLSDRYFLNVPNYKSSSNTKHENSEILKKATKRECTDQNTYEMKRKKEESSYTKIRAKKFIKKERRVKSSREKIKVAIDIKEDYKLELKYEQEGKNKNHFIARSKDLIDNFNDVMCLLDKACCENKIDEILREAENDILKNCDLLANIKEWSLKNSIAKSYKNSPVIPLLSCRGCTVTGTTLDRLKLFSSTDYSQLESELQPSFDVYSPSSEYSKTCKPTPIYKVIVLGSTDALPSLTQIELIRKQYDTPILVAVVYPDSISFLRSTSIDLIVP